MIKSGYVGGFKESQVVVVEDRLAGLVFRIAS